MNLLAELAKGHKVFGKHGSGEYNGCIGLDDFNANLHPLMHSIS